MAARRVAVAEVARGRRKAEGGLGFRVQGLGLGGLLLSNRPNNFRSSCS